MNLWSTTISTLVRCAHFFLISLFIQFISHILHHSMSVTGENVWVHAFTMMENLKNAMLIFQIEQFSLPWMCWMASKSAVLMTGDSAATKVSCWELSAWLMEAFSLEQWTRIYSGACKTKGNVTESGKIRKQNKWLKFRE